ncbi:hypothetical protein IHE44_0002240 [Lamprotornis superbus]|uniref:Ankyrin repeat domain-containing protein 27 n=1 Tax=Lamprotornis superbus TaxID=245042 RepID=A0A835NVC2_9PASS|nr:hypothetical protein IHE44_0002240 [Lamprotornis superbus]
MLQSDVLIYAAKLQNSMDSVNALYTKCLQHLLRDSHLKMLAKQEEQMNLIKQAVEMYIHHAIYDLVFKYVGTIEASEDADFNKITRSLQDLQQKDIGVKPEFRMANLSYIKNFRLCSSVKDELGYCLTSIEAAIEYIRQGNLSDRSTESESLCDKLLLRQRMNLLSQMSAAPIDCLFKHIASGDQEEVERLLSQGDSDKDTVQKMCHPLCYCDKCEKLVSGKLNDPSIITPFSRDDRGYTPLHIAAICGQTSLVDLLVAKGAIVNATDYHGSAPLHLACQKGYQSVTLLLLHYKASTDVQDNNGNTPLHLACTYGHEDCVKALVYYDVHSCRLDIGNEKGDTALHIAARWGYQGIIEVLLQNGANPEIQNRMKETSLQCALNSKVEKLLRAVADGDLEMKFSRICSNGLGVNVSNQDGFTPLHMAALHGHGELAALLLRHGASGKHGASVNLCNAKGNTALHEAVASGNEALVALLLQNGALRHLRNERSCTAADCAEPMAIKCFDKSKLKSVGTLAQSTVQVTDTGCSGEFVEDDDTAAPPRNKLMQRRHTVNVPLPAEEGSDCGSRSPAEPGSI